MEKREYSTIFRIMHWAIAICMLFMLLTIFLRMNWMNKNNVADIIQNYLSNTEQVLSDDEAIVLAKQIRKPMWEWHVYIGYVLVGLYSLRLLLPFLGMMKFTNPFRSDIDIKARIQFLIYIIFYICVGISLFTGMMIVLGPKSLKSAMESVHILSIYYLVIYILLHFGGVLYAEFTNQPGLVSKIISGGKKVE